MLYLLDTANLDHIKRAFDLYPMDGVTTNPSIISAEKTDFIQHMNKIKEIIGDEAMIHAQVLSTNAMDIVEEAKFLHKTIGGNFYVKIPVTPEGIKAMKIISGIGINITATAIFTAQQALMAAKAGAKFVAPYVNRTDNISGDGVHVVSEIVKLFDIYNLDTKVLAASFVNVQQVHSSMLEGAHSVTLNMKTFEQLIYHPMTDWSIDKFINDWESVYGKDKTTMNLK